MEVVQELKESLINQILSLNLLEVLRITDKKIINIVEICPY